MHNTLPKMASKTNKTSRGTRISLTKSMSKLQVAEKTTHAPPHAVNGEDHEMLEATREHHVRA